MITTATAPEAPASPVRPQRQPLSRHDLLSALRAAQAYRRAEDARWAEYEADVARDRAEGHRPHFCFHGMNLWTDYDNICWACEEYGFNGRDPLDAYRSGLAYARNKRDVYGHVIDALLTLQVEGLAEFLDQDGLRAALAKRFIH